MEEAIGELRQAVELYPPARYDLGVQYYKLERFDEAIAELQQFVALEPGLFTTSAAHTLIGGALDRRRRPLEAIDAYRRAVSGPLPDVQAHGFLADLLLDQQKYEEAIQHYRLYLQGVSRPGAGDDESRDRAGIDEPDRGCAQCVPPRGRCRSDKCAGARESRADAAGREAGGRGGGRSAADGDARAAQRAGV
jgi:hypothetical protein